MANTYRRHQRCTGIFQDDQNAETEEAFLGEKERTDTLFGCSTRN